MDPFSYAGEIAKGGLGYVLFLFTIALFLMREKMNNDEKKELRNEIIIVNEKRLEDLKQIQEVSYARTKEERAFYDVSTDKIKGAMDTIGTMIRDMNNFLNYQKK